MFLDDAKIKNFTSCYKEQKFLDFFFKNLRIAETQRHNEDFKFVSNCGREKNYLKCDDLPFVATHLDESNDLLQINNLRSAEWSLKFDPTNLVFNTVNGRLYYFFEDKYKQLDQTNGLKRKHRFEKLPCKMCLIKSNISIKLMSKLKQIDENIDLKFEFQYKSKVYQLSLSTEKLYQEQLDKFSSYDEKNSEN